MTSKLKYSNSEPAKRKHHCNCFFFFGIPGFYILKSSNELSQLHPKCENIYFLQGSGPTKFHNGASKSLTLMSQARERSAHFSEAEFMPPKCLFHFLNKSKLNFCKQKLQHLRWFTNYWICLTINSIVLQSWPDHCWTLYSKNLIDIRPYLVSHRKSLLPEPP